MSSTIAEIDQRALILHPDAAVNRPGAALPHAMSDPNPRLTLALHNLWAALRPFLSLTEERGSYRPPLFDSKMVITDALASVRSSLVRPLFFYLRAILLSSSCVTVCLWRYTGEDWHRIGSRISCPSLVRLSF
jgi:hypothetical protein